MNSTEFEGVVTGANSTRPPEIYRFIPGMIPKPHWDVISPTPTRTTFNGSGFYLEDDAEIGFNDIQTLFLACFATITPLVLTVIAGFGIRALWRKYIRRKENKLYVDASQTEVSIDSTSQPLHTHLYNNDKRSTETHLTIETDEVCETATTHSTTNSTQNPRPSNHSNTNGSIITMTLKNNHLIVETEERNDLEEDSRATKMKYSPSARDGVFVVEVQQGVRRSPGSANLPIIDESDQTALIHDPPAKYSDDDEILIESDTCLDYPETTSPVNKENLKEGISNLQTGLTQSDQSLSQFSYTYGNQTEYTDDVLGYSSTVVNTKSCDLEPKVECKEVQAKSTKPKITSAIFKSVESIKSFELLSDDVLSDLVISNSKQSSKDDDDSIQEEQNRLGNCASSLTGVPETPIEKHTDKTIENPSETCENG